MDYNNSVKNEDKTNNYLFRPAFKTVKAYINVSVDSSFSVLNDLIKEYISSFVEVTNISGEADIIINVGNKGLPDFKNDNKFMTKAYTGYVKRDLHYEQGYLAKPRITIYGTRIEGTIAGVKRMVDARNVFFDNMYIANYISYIDNYDTLGISVMDLMHNSETKIHFNQNNDALKEDVRKILYNNNFEVSVKSVKTLNTTSYNASTILRVKHVNSDFSLGYKDAVGISDKPVVFSGGLFSSLTTWEEDNGLAKQMSQEGWDVWEIEMTGGPYTDCEGFTNDTCPNYNYDDLVDYYWPALIAGVQEYSGKNQIDYVGHSNGCRAALSSLNSYSNSGKNNAGYYFDYNTGNYTYSDLAQNSVNTFVGVACPATLNDNTLFTEGARELKEGNHKGDLAILSLNQSNKKHINRIEYATKTNPVLGLITFGGAKISLNLMDFYNDLAIETNSSITLDNFNATNLYLIFGIKDYNIFTSNENNDGFVYITDMDIINQSVTQSINKSSFIINASHSGIIRDSEFTRYVKTRLK